MVIEKNSCKDLEERTHLLKSIKYSKMPLSKEAKDGLRRYKMGQTHVNVPEETPIRNCKDEQATMSPPVRVPPKGKTKMEKQIERQNAELKRMRVQLNTHAESIHVLNVQQSRIGGFLKRTLSREKVPATNGWHIAAVAFTGSIATLLAPYILPYVGIANLGLAIGLIFMAYGFSTIHQSSRSADGDTTPSGKVYAASAHWEKPRLGSFQIILYRSALDGMSILGKCVSFIASKAVLASVRVIEIMLVLIHSLIIQAARFDLTKLIKYVWTFAFLIVASPYYVFIYLRFYFWCYFTLLPFLQRHFPSRR